MYFFYGGVCTISCPYGIYNINTLFLFACKVKCISNGAMQTLSFAIYDVCLNIRYPTSTYLLCESQLTDCNIMNRKQ